MITKRLLAREGIILLGCLLLAVAGWSWAAVTAEHFPPFQVVMLNPSTNGVLLYVGLAMVRLLVWTGVRLWRQAV